MPGSKSKPSQAIRVRTSADVLASWDRAVLVRTLCEEARLEPDDAASVAQEVEKEVFGLGLATIPSSLIRELANVTLVSRGLKKHYALNQRLGISFHEIESIYFPPKDADRDIEASPGTLDRILSGRVKREYALNRVFTERVGQAHLEGQIHINGLEALDRLYSSTQSLEYVKKFGVDIHQRLPASRPAKYVEVFLSQFLTMTQALRENFHGPIGWDAVNIFLAPFFDKKGDRILDQIAQSLVYQVAQMGGGERTQPLEVDLHLYWEVPEHIGNVIAMGPGGKSTKRTYYEYAVESQRFLWSLLKVFREGDSLGQPFAAPRPLLHITEKFFTTMGSRDFLAEMCRLASEKGTITFVFDRKNTILINHCGRINFLAGAEFMEATEPWKMRYHSLQNVTLNLPRAGYVAQGSQEQLLKEIHAAMELAAEAHAQKRQFIFRLLQQGTEGPFTFLTAKRGGKLFLRQDRLASTISIAGLNELAQYSTGYEIHEREKAYKFALMILNHIDEMAKTLGEKHKLPMILEDPPSDEAGLRFAQLDLNAFPAQASLIVKGEQESNAAYYNHSVTVDVEAELDPFIRCKMEGAFHSKIAGGSVSTIWLGGHTPNIDKLLKLVEKVFKETKCEQMTFAPDFTRCFQCGALQRGLSVACGNPECRSNRVDGLSKSLGRYTWMGNFTRKNLYNFLQRYDNRDYLG